MSYNKLSVARPLKSWIDKITTERKDCIWEMFLNLLNSDEHSSYDKSSHIVAGELVVL